MKRLTLTAAVFAATSLTLPLAFGAAALAQDAIDDSPATGTLQVWVGGADGERLPELLADFKAANPDLDLQITPIPSDQFDSKLLTAIAAGTVPDVVRLYSQSQASLMVTGAFAPVPEGLVNPDDFFPGAYGTNVKAGVAYGVPTDAYATLFQYRKDLADKAGLSAPTTWEEMKTFTKAMQEQGATWGMGTDVGYDIYNAQGLNEYVHQNGGSFTNADQTEWTFNTPENIGALEFWASFFKEGIATPDGPAFLDTVPWFTSGEIASRDDMGPWFEQFLVDANGREWVDANLATAPMPAGPAGSFSALGSGSYAVLKDSKNPTAAWKFVRYLAKPETQIAWYKIFGSLPSVKSAWDDPSIANNKFLDAERVALQTAVDIPQVPTWNEVGTYLGQQTERVARGQATAKEVLDDVQSFAESVGMGD